MYQIASDLHISPYKVIELPILPSRVIILAGDIAEGLKGLEFAEKIAQEHHKLVVYVPGNHEYYRHNYIELQTEMRLFAEQSENANLILKEAGFLLIEKRHEDTFNSGPAKYTFNQIWEKVA